MSETRSTLENIAHAFAGELEARDDRLAKLITDGFEQLNTRLAAVEQRLSTQDQRLTAQEQSDRNLLQAMGNLQGQIAALSRVSRS